MLDWVWGRGFDCGVEEEGEVVCVCVCVCVRVCVCCVCVVLSFRTGGAREGAGEGECGNTWEGNAN